MKRLQWTWCWFAFKVFRALPTPRHFGTRYWDFNMWWLGYGGAYAHSEDFEDFRKHVRFTS